MSEYLDDILGSEELNTLNVETNDADMRRIVDLANKQINLEQEVVGLEQQLKNKKEELRNVKEHDLPDAFAEVGLSEIKLQDGSRVKVEPFVNAHISKANTEKAHAWLEDNGFGDLIDKELNAKFGRTDAELEKFQRMFSHLEENGCKLTTKEAVHHMRLKAFAKEQLEKGTDVPVDLFGLYTGLKTTIAKK